jgi:hypothetical protein
MSTIKDLIQEYRELVILKNRTPKMTKGILEIFEELMDALEAGLYEDTCTNSKTVQWQKELAQVTDYESAALAFYDMSVRGFNKNLASLLSFYFASKVINSTSSPITKENFHSLRAVVVFKRSSKFLYYAEKAMNQHYSGKLNNKNFFDVLLLSDVFLGWNGNIITNTFSQLKEKSSNISVIHNYLTRNDILVEGQKACRAIFDSISDMLKYPYFTVSER